MIIDAIDLKSDFKRRRFFYICLICMSYLCKKSTQSKSKQKFKFNQNENENKLEMRGGNSKRKGCP